jgi:hypothetical protein
VTTAQLNLFNALYLLVLIAVAILTRATLRRIAGALIGGAATGIAGAGVIAFCEYAGWWRFVIPWSPYFLVLWELGFAIGGFVFLITWRIARRFGSRGLGVAVLIAAIIGPPRDYWYMQKFPEWGSYGPGVTPILAISGAYVVLGIVGHVLMRLVAGPSGSDPLARRLWKTSRV